MISITAINAAVQSIVGIGKITSDIKNGISNKDKDTDLLIQFDTMRDGIFEDDDEGPGFE